MESVCDSLREEKDSLSALSIVGLVVFSIDDVVDNLRCAGKFLEVMVDILANWDPTMTKARNL